MRESVREGLMCALIMSVFILGFTGIVMNMVDYSPSSYNPFTYEDCNNQRCYRPISPYDDDSWDRFFEGFPDDGRSYNTPYVLEGIVYDFSPERDDHGIGASKCCPIRENMIDISNTIRFILIRNCTFKNVECAIRMWSSSYVRIENCTFINCNYAVRAYLSDNTYIRDCIFINGYQAILGSNNWIIQNSKIENYDNGIQLQGNGAVISGNELINCTEIGISTGTGYNSIYSNTLTNTYISAAFEYIDGSNSINSLPIEKYYYETSLEFKNEILGSKYLVNCSDITITNCSVTAPIYMINSINLSLTNSSFQQIPLDNMNFISCVNVSITSCNFTNGYRSLDLWGSNNVTIFDCFAKNMEYHIGGGANVTIENNTIDGVNDWNSGSAPKTIINNRFQNSYIGLELLNSSYTYAENNLYNSLPIDYQINKTNFDVAPGYGFHYIYNCTNFTMNNTSFDTEDFYFWSCHDFEIYNSIFQDSNIIDLEHCENFTINSSKFLHTQNLIEIYYGEYFSIQDCIFNNSLSNGLSLARCENFKVESSSFNSNLEAGLFVHDGRFFQIRGSNFTDNEDGCVLLHNFDGRIELCRSGSNSDSGILLIDCDHLTIYRNQMYHNGHGMHLLWSEDFWIIENQITENTKSGIWLLGCTNRGYDYRSFKVYNSTILDNYLDIVHQNEVYNPNEAISFLNQIGTEVRIATNTSIHTKYYSYNYRITIRNEGIYYNSDLYETTSVNWKHFFVQDYETPSPSTIENSEIQTYWEGFP